MSHNPPEPRSAATLLLLRDNPLQVLMVQRHASAAFASALVFPGGVVDPLDQSDAWLPYVRGADGLAVAERGLRIAAVRETFEETGLLVANAQAGEIPPPDLPAGASFLDQMAARQAVLDLAALVPFAHWITPPVETRRFDTRFFVTAAPDDGQVAVCDGGETVGLEWTTPAAALAAAAAGARVLMFPTRANLQRLAESRSVAEALAAARARPAFTVMPKLERRPEGLFVTIPQQAGYACSEIRVEQAMGRRAGAGQAS